MDEYPALAVMARHGLPVAAGAGVVVLLLFIWAGNGAGPPFWYVVGVLGGIATCFLLLVVSDIVRIIADTLIPAP